MAVDAIARAHSAPALAPALPGRGAPRPCSAASSVLLLKPTTFMNDSGRAVAEAQRFFKIPLADVVVFHDELDLAPGQAAGEDRRRQCRP